MADTDRRELHTLVDHIPAGEVPAARKILRALMDPVELSLLSAPVDDEPETEDERTAGGLARVRSVRRFQWTDQAKDELRKI